MRAGWLLAAAVGLLALGQPSAERGEAAEQTPEPPAGGAAGWAEWEKVRRALAPHPSTDTTPVEFSVGGIHYRMPRNYLLTMDNWAGGRQSMVTIRVNLPDLKPFGDDNRACFTGAPADRPAGCRPIAVVIDPPGGPTAEQAFDRWRDLFHNQAPIKTPFSLDKYEAGPPDTRIEFYRGNGKIPLYNCNHQKKRQAVCKEISDRLPNSTVIFYFFDIDQLPKIKKINAGLIKLVSHLEHHDQKFDNYGD